MWWLTGRTATYMQNIAPFSFMVLYFQNTQLPFQEWIPSQTDFVLKKTKQKQQQKEIPNNPTYTHTHFIVENLKCKDKDPEKIVLFSVVLVVFVHVSNEHRATPVLSSDFTSKGQVGSCGSILPCQQHSWLPHYINFLFPFKREFIQLNSFKTFIFSFLKRSICILFVLVLGGFQKSCLNFLHF